MTALAHSYLDGTAKRKLVLFAPDFTRHDVQAATTPEALAQCQGLAGHIVALASAFLGDDTELADRLAAVSHGEVVALALELADRSAWARQAIWLSLDARGSR